MTDDARDLGERLEEAAIRAELATGAREPTTERAKSHIVVRLARITLGIAVLAAGIAMIALPGPGWLTIAAGLVILSRDFVWAERTLRYVRRKAPGVPEDGKIPTSALVTMIAMGLLFAGAGVWWYLLR